ncbi:galactose mutarotase-like protein [Punctularia strigosozonata HHB-11173 SS5]|uniref:galactose mutarotase-like protein n=1 Tax=Punctularia strigosozonata (strain HHB-11173) TaxID=741275 RepID=UPI0004417198|nr:galactose mutarotase-like protein [Punctularia strigosozonata HHB-11173 SS5]EIN10115.1 galactose mutarotase-like protein [Punctularia strigosozonata HHB-11173 SS5]
MSADDGFKPILLALPSLAPALALEVLPRGLTLHRLFVQADGRTHDVLVGPEDPSDHAKMPYTNSVIGPYTNRIPTGAHTLTSSRHPTITSVITPASNSAEANQNVCLHSGPGSDPWDKRIWEPLDPSHSALFTPAEKNTIASLPAAQIFSITSKDGQGGFPGSVRSEVLVGLLSAPPPPKTDVDQLTLGSVILVYRAKLVEGQNVITPINLTQHWGFNLEASLRPDGEPRSVRPEPDVKGHLLKIKSDATIALDKNYNSAGSLAPAKGTYHDHSTGKLIGDGWPDVDTGKGVGYDEFYAFSAPLVPPQVIVPASQLTDDVDLLKAVVESGTTTTQTDEPVVELSSDKSGLKLSFFTNQSGVQFYTANSYDRSNARKKIHGGTGKFGTGEGYGVGGAAFLEFHEPLAAWLNPDTVRNGNDTLLGPGELYNNWVRLDVSYKRPDA